MDSIVTPGCAPNEEWMHEEGGMGRKWWRIRRRWIRRNIGIDGRERGGSIAMEGLRVPEGGRTLTHFIIF